MPSQGVKASPRPGQEGQEKRPRQELPLGWGQLERTQESVVFAKKVHEARGVCAFRRPVSALPSRS
eukprot:457117-Pleurochrysis_carterae.AAC.3